MRAELGRQGLRRSKEHAAGKRKPWRRACVKSARQMAAMPMGSATPTKPAGCRLTPEGPFSRPTGRPPQDRRSSAAAESQMAADSKPARASAPPRAELPVLRAPYAPPDEELAARFLAEATREAAAEARIDARATGLLA